MKWDTRIPIFCNFAFYLGFSRVCCTLDPTDFFFRTTPPTPPCKACVRDFDSALHGGVGGDSVSKT